MTRLPFIVEVRGLRAAAGWIVLADTDSDDVEEVRRDMIAQGFRGIIDSREWRIVARAAP